MKNEALSSTQWLKAFVLITLLLGILFRFINLDQKPYWHDETYTSLYLSGYSAQEAMQQLFTGQVIRAKDLLQFQSPSTVSGVFDTITRLATDNSQHPPLYYGIARLWAGYFGASITAMRVLPALISLLALPGIYWLGLELFASPSVGWMAMCLWAVSPLSIRYAQEARQYSLWIVIVLFSSVLLLRAMRSKKIWNWIFYLLTLILGLYCHTLFSLTLLGHGLYVLLIERFRLNQIVTRYLLATGVAILSFTPWLWTMYQHRERVAVSTAWTKQPVPLFSLLQSWGIHLCQIFTAWHFRHDERLVYLAIPILFLLIFAINTLCRHSPKRGWLFILILLGASILPIFLPDLIWGGRRSLYVRYFLPFYLGIDLAIAYCLVYQITQKYTKAVHRRLWQVITALLVTCSILSSAIASQAQSWWGWSEFDVDISCLMNRAHNPLLIADMPLGAILPLSHRLAPNTKLILLTEPETLKIPETSGDIFFYHPSDRLKAVMVQQNLEPQRIYQFQDDSLTLSLYHLPLSQARKYPLLH
jgi:uncharacterized membrane protein